MIEIEKIKALLNENSFLEPCDQFSRIREIEHVAEVLLVALENCVSFIFSQKYFDCSAFSDIDHWLSYAEYQVIHKNAPENLP